MLSLCEEQLMRMWRVDVNMHLLSPFRFYPECFSRKSLDLHHHPRAL